jgi:hypothetical protein
MRDVRNLQAMLSEGITDPALLYRQLEDAGPLEIPDDGKEHRCSCGEYLYRAWDGDGFAFAAYGHLLVTDDEGRTVESCRGCDRELVASPPRKENC